MIRSVLIVSAAGGVSGVGAALIAAGAAILVAAVNVWQQRKQLKEQLGEQLERQLTAQRDQLKEQLGEQREQLERQLGVAREGQQTERFTRAVEQLGDDKPAVGSVGFMHWGRSPRPLNETEEPSTKCL